MHNNNKMYKKLLSSETKKFIANIKVASILIQFTFLAFPLSMYIVYNKVVVSKNTNSLLIVIIFLVSVLIIQLSLKTLNSIQQNILKTDSQIKRHQQYINNKFNSNDNIIDNKPKYNISELGEVSAESNIYIQNQISNAYYIFICIYLGLILLVGKFLVIVPMFFFGMNYLAANKLTKYYEKNNDGFNKIYNEKAIFIKEILLKIKTIKGLNIKDKVIDEFYSITKEANTKKCLTLYIKNMMLKLGMVFNILNIAFILIFGRYLFSIGILEIQEVITCSLLTVWISRSINQILTNLHKSKNRSQETNKNIEFQEDQSGLKYFSSEYYDNLKSKLHSSEIIYCDCTNRQLSLKSLYKRLIKDYDTVSYINNNFKLFYGTIIDNITLFDKEKDELAKAFIHDFGFIQTIYNLPYNFNYVTTGEHDETIPYDLKLGIIIIRELIRKPELVVIDIDIKQISNTILSSLAKFVEGNDTKLIFRK